MTSLPRDLPLPPGPASLPATPQNPLEQDPALQRQYGDVVSYGPGAGAYLISDPGLIEFIHVQTGRLFDKGYLQEGGGMGRIFGNGLVVSEGSFWLRQRRMIQPAFHKGRIQAYGQTMLTAVERTLTGWHDGETRDLHAELMELTLDIILKCLFDVEPGSGRDFGAAMDDLLGSVAALYQATPEQAPAIGARFEDAAKRIDGYTARLIAQRRAEQKDHGDLLGSLLAAQDDAGGGMTDAQLLDESKTLIMAGHETTSNALGWTFWLLAGNPEAEAALHAELDAVLAHRSPQLTDLERLPYTRAVILEAMRLMPPVWNVSRRARQDLELGGYRVPAGTVLSMSQWVVHKDPRWFDSPLAFRPERWLGGLEKQLPKYAYFPFGGGPRVCIGENFARMEAVLLLAAIAQRFSLSLVGGPVVPEPGITLRPRGGLPMTLEARRGR